MLQRSLRSRHGRGRYAAGLGLLLSFSLLGTGFSHAGSLLPAQPNLERQRQKIMPVAPDALWSTLRTTKVAVNTKTGAYNAAIPVEVLALSGHPMTITGYMLPLDPSKRFNHFVLTRNTPVCAFCMPGEPNEVVEIYTSRFVTYSEGLVQVTGQFAVQDSGETGLFFKIDQARMQ